MNLTPSLDIPCPDDTDYAAMPLYLQRLAEQTEAMLVERDAKLTAFLNPKIAIWENFDSFTQDTTGLTNIDIFDTPVYSNFGGASMNFCCREFFQAGGPGVYHIGYQARMFATGAISDDSPRMIDIFVQRIVPDSQTTVTHFGRRINGLAAATGDNYLLAESVFVVGEDFASYQMEGQITHGNAGSTMTINYRRAWVTIYSGLDLVEVV